MDIILDKHAQSYIEMIEQNVIKPKPNISGIYQLDSGNWIGFVGDFELEEFPNEIDAIRFVMKQRKQNDTNY